MTAGEQSADLQLHAVRGIGEIRPGDDLPAIVAAAVAPLEPVDGDIVVVTSKVVSKAEGRIRPAAEREQAITEESVRLVASRPAR
jgi:coenzyme F420-0:L-glutamate ligase/coenzyme F420-1:gamma-L-glutamate ligase